MSGTLARVAGAIWVATSSRALGQEVLVSFIEGDIDRRVVIGSPCAGLEEIKTEQPREVSLRQSDSSQQASSKAERFRTRAKTSGCSHADTASISQPLPGARCAPAAACCSARMGDREARGRVVRGGACNPNVRPAAGQDLPLNLDVVRVAGVEEPTTSDWGAT